MLLTCISLFQLLFASLLLCGSDASRLHKHTHLGKRFLRRGVSHEERHVRRDAPAAYGLGVKVTNSMAKWDNANMYDGSNYTVDQYTYYSGGPENFPSSKNWVSFEAMFQANTPLMKKSCGWNGWGPDNTDRQIGFIKTYIQQVARASRVDHRAILAVIMQESGGCLYAPTTNNGVINPGIMQSHNGVSFNPLAPVTTIRQMIIDGTMGTAYGDGLVQLLNKYSNYYKAFRAYNSGSIHSSGDLSNGNGATPCYVSDIANRLQGWTFAPNACRAAQ